MPQAVYRFGEFELDVARFALHHHGRAVKLERNPLELLILLAENGGNVVSRPEIVQRLWGKDVFVDTEHGINTAVRKIRAALDEQSERPRFLFTVPGKGYRLVLDPVPPSAAAPVPEPSTRAAEAPGVETPAVLPPAAPAPRIATRAKFSVIAALAALTVAAAALAVWASRPMSRPEYTQVTNFTDASLVSPAVSPDGRMIAFIRESEPTFPIPGDVFAKRLPNSEAVQLTHDGLPKYGVAFSPDGSEITYTVATSRTWNTMAVPVLGGEPRLVLTNASGLTWLASHRVLFSEFTAGIHMGLVTSTDTRADLRRIYLPVHERGMAHQGSLSPDGKWVLVVEMGPDGRWQPCRLVPFDGSNSGIPVGPPGSHCTASAWSPDGTVMYFTLNTSSGSHVWRQRFPNGTAEQLTFGPADDVGLAFAPDGRSVLTSLGTVESGLWIHDGSGERSLSSEGFAWIPSYSQDGRTLFYMLGGLGSSRPSELWTLDVDSGRSRPLIQGFTVTSYDVSEDGRSIVFAARSEEGRSELWLAAADHSSAPRKLTASGADSPFFGAGGRILFRAAEGARNYLFEMQPDGSHRDKIRPEPIVELSGRSFDRRWVVSLVPVEGPTPVATVLIPLAGGDQRRVCPALCNVRWSPSGDRVYVQPVQDFPTGETLLFQLAGGEVMPKWPPEGIASVTEGKSLPGASVVLLGSARSYAVPGPSPDTFVYTKTVAHRNLFWISLR